MDRGVLGEMIRPSYACRVNDHGGARESGRFARPSSIRPDLVSLSRNRKMSRATPRWSQRSNRLAPSLSASLSLALAPIGPPYPSPVKSLRSHVAEHMDRVSGPAISRPAFDFFFPAPVRPLSHLPREYFRHPITSNRQRGTRAVTETRASLISLRRSCLRDQWTAAGSSR